ncbi:hypothetical protein [Corynebacterium aquilae]|uniref:Uncharacterized protein n=1 Tax=Corynebacterium aquilae DSM 44791 TaxID=1431546 RepID=A0A1L7CIC9_9CORY|nr:hypothetical protein [Corynebacterium aquilae]APT85622.1 hypothetical protein CAQU_11880 [Corynebacterium aquilae DSM 44791]
MDDTTRPSQEERERLERIDALISRRDELARKKEQAAQQRAEQAQLEAQKVGWRGIFTPSSMMWTGAIFLLLWGLQVLMFRRDEPFFEHWPKAGLALGFICAGLYRAAVKDKVPAVFDALGAFFVFFVVLAATFAVAIMLPH